MTKSSSTRVAIHWTGPNTYLRACVDALTAVPGHPVEVILTFVPGPNAKYTAYPDSTVLPLNASISFLSGIRDNQPLRRFQDDPFDLHLFSGRWVPAYRHLARSLNGRARRGYVTDQGMVANKEFFARVLWFRTVGRSYFDYAFVPGDQQVAHAKVLGFQAAKIWRGVLATSRPTDLPVINRRDAFLFVGRLVEEKGVRQLAAGYAAYREQVGSAAWPLVVVGMGPLAPLLHDVEGVVSRGFLDPSQLWTELLAARALILPSTVEPWGVVLQEAALAELPVVASAHCGGAGYFVRDGWNGWILPSVHPDDIATILRTVHEARGSLEAMGKRSAVLAGQFSPEQWAATVLRMAHT
jgi:glycosyltransferase involved in cell wall biosynthesis